MNPYNNFGKTSLCTLQTSNAVISSYTAIYLQCDRQTPPCANGQAISVQMQAMEKLLSDLCVLMKNFIVQLKLPPFPLESLSSI